MPEIGTVITVTFEVQGNALPGLKNATRNREGLSCFITKLLEGITWEGEAPECEIVGLTAVPVSWKRGWVYVCQKGQRFDGHDFAEKALELGAAAVVVDRDLGLPRQIRVEDTHAVYPLLCANFFGRPADSMKMIGVTGTNGQDHQRLSHQAPAHCGGTPHRADRHGTE